MDDYLKQLADLLAEQQRLGKEEQMGFSEEANKHFGNLPMTSNQRFPLTKKLISENPNLPQDDIQEYKQNVVDDQENNMVNSVANVAGLNMLGKMAKPLVPAIMKPLANKFPKIGQMVNKLENNMFAENMQNKINLRDKLNKPSLISEEELIESYKKIPELDELAKKRISNQTMKDTEDLVLERAKKESNNPVALEQTVPLDELLKKIGKK